MREINNRLELSEASAALVAIPRGNSTANFDIKKTLFARSSRHSSAFAVLGKCFAVNNSCRFMLYSVGTSTEQNTEKVLKNDHKLREQS